MKGLNVLIVNHTKWVLQNIPNECIWHERWPVWGYVDIESMQFSFTCTFKYLWHSLVVVKLVHVYRGHTHLFNM